MKRVIIIVLVLAVIGAAVWKKDQLTPLIQKVSGLVQKVSGLSSSSPSAPAQSGAEPSSPESINPSLPPAAATPDPAAQVKATIISYMQSNAQPGTKFQFLDWSHYAVAGRTAIITAHYSVQRPGQQDVLAGVRFTLRDGRYYQGENIQNAVITSGESEYRKATPAPTPVPIPVDHFTGTIMAAMTDDSTMTFHPNDAFSLDELPEAKQRAQQEKKPIGFLMVWGQFFDHPSNSHGQDSVSALVHFYRVFHDNMIFVFVRHETELDKVPPAVAKGFRGPDEGGFAPNMAVTDATATEFIVEIPYKNLDETGRGTLFATGGKVIDKWEAFHPDAAATPAPGQE